MEVFASLVAIGAADVEYSASGVPTAFRIWRSGVNTIDKEGRQDHIFSANSAALLLKEQAARGNLYSIDVDHLSMNPAAPPLSHKAVGWHRLEVRAGDLWATGVEWIPEVAKAFEAAAGGAVPEWRYFSPAYATDKATNEIVSYVNTALTNNPATRHVTALANVENPAPVKQGASISNKAKRTMDLDEAKAALAALAAMGDVDEKDEAKRKAAVKAAKQAKAALAAFEKDPDAEGEKPAPDAEEKKPMGDMHDEAATVAASLEASVKALSAQVATLLAEQTASKRAALLAARPDITPELRKELADKDPATVASILAAVPKAPVLAATALEAATKATRGDAATRADRSAPEIAARLDRAMGLVTATRDVENDGAVLRLGVSKVASRESK